MATQISIVNTLTIAQRALFLQYANQCVMRNSSSLSDFRTLLLYREKAYQRTLDTTADHIKAVRANLNGDARKLQNLTVPIVMPQVESAVAYQTGVYLTSNPIFGVVTYPDNMNAALQFETAIGDQSIKYGWARELIKVFRDGYKHNFGVACIEWKKTPIKQVVTDTSISLAGMQKLQEYSYGGNCIVHVDPHNCFMDMTVPPSTMHTDGEFFGYNKPISRIMLKKLISVLDPQKTTGAKEALESSFAGTTSMGTTAMGYNVPQVNPLMSVGAINYNSNDWGQRLHLPGYQRNDGINYKDTYMLTHFYCRAMPADFDIKGSGVNTPKVYHAILINWKHVLFVEEMNTAHDFLPAFIMQPTEDGLGYQTQSMADTAMPFQDMSSSLWNMTLEAKRRAIFDRLIYNPTMIDKKDIDPASSVSRIPLRNMAMAKGDTNPIQRAVYQIPYREDNLSSNLQMSDMLSGMADSASGQNKVDRGQFQKGNKTKTEFTETMSNSNSRQQLSSISIEHQFMNPVKETIKSNTLQYQTTAKLLNRTERKAVDVDPIKLREAILEFKMTDGMLPADKLMNSELLTVFLQTAQALPAMATEYDVMGMFIYWAKLHGAYWIEDFKRDSQKQQDFLQVLRQTTEASTPPDPAMQAAQAGLPPQQ